MKKADLSKLDKYELISKQNIDDLKSVGYLLKHKRSGARVVVMENDDDNKVFYIGFRTTPKDSTGVMHILEHSVLCGSRDFPVKDPFVELVKGSLNTFLNAMTYPDKTVYPVASTNDKDFQNLMHVYLDAVFYPNILKNDLTFKQEGWHYEMNDEDDDITINGVVYNEMKGAFSSPDDVLEREIFNSLFPDTTYGNESGGAPKAIPELTYEAFIDTYKKYYHPSNSYIYLYGDMDFEEKLAFIDEKYLSSFDEIKVDSEVEVQKSFDKPVEVKKSFSITASEPAKENTYLSYNAVFSNSLDPEEYIALQIIDYALCSAPGAVLKQALLDKGIAKDAYSFYENGIKQPYFSIIAKNSDEDKKQSFLDTIEEVLTQIVKNGFYKDTLRAALNAFEFKYREADFGSYPPGLMYGLQALDSWLYDDNKPFIHISCGDTFKKLREKIDTGYFENLIEKYLLKNSHRSVVVVVPEIGLVEKEDKELAAKLSQFKETLTKEQIKDIVKKTKELKEYQESEDSPEDLERIPLLELKDIKKETGKLYNEVRDIDGVKTLYHGVDTHGIDYIRLIFDMSKISEELYAYAGILKNTMGLVDTKNYTYSELFDRINILTGGIAPVCNIYTDSKDLDSNTVTFEWKAKVLEGGLSDAFDLLKEIIFTSVLDNEKRNRELVSEMRSRAQATMMSSGHQVAMGRLGTYFSKGAVLTDRLSGYTGYKLVEKTDNDYDGQKKVYMENLIKLTGIIFKRENLMFDFAGSEAEYEDFKTKAKAFLTDLKAFEDSQKSEAGLKAFDPVPDVKNEGIMNSSQVNYVCRGGNFVNKGLPYTGSLRVLRVIMSYDYLWLNVRVKNGAYGCMSAFGKGGDSFFVSYRDPNLKKTLDTYEGIVDYVDSFDIPDRAMTQYIIGAISDLDAPLTPSAKALRSLSAYMTNYSEADYQKERDEVLSTNVNSIRDLSKYMKAILEDGYICVVGNEEAIKSEKELFDNLENMIEKA